MDPTSFDLPDTDALKHQRKLPLYPLNKFCDSTYAPAALKGLSSFHCTSERAVF
jgi:hypothetical protein